MKRWKIQIQKSGCRAAHLTPQPSLARLQLRHQCRTLFQGRSSNSFDRPASVASVGQKASSQFAKLKKHTRQEFAGSFGKAHGPAPSSLPHFVQKTMGLSTALPPWLRTRAISPEGACVEFTVVREARGCEQRQPVGSLTCRWHCQRLSSLPLCPCSCAAHPCLWP